MFFARTMLRSRLTYLVKAAAAKILAKTRVRKRYVFRLLGLFFFALMAAYFLSDFIGKITTTTNNQLSKSRDEIDRLLVDKFQKPNQDVFKSA